ncbi:3-deoxy-D-manno-octulosonic acid kinase [Kangiella sediminilitoris]|uniref:3-deoxy-D-manno-octulosonic acid kinase n=1 Tax=Kangiella sediminilitoris TaxID=1144748 RepID=A0A1B3B859_9GAMM|nr:3-deoxy-D-manno-octulosonic acid kinase [Kangiella sediminilitoris]AOE48994.1 3-deoxy-D-manno-octulosonic acid kinase [Kangiella sediminilitoris]
MKIQQIDKNRFMVAVKKYREKVTKDWFDPEQLKKNDEIIGQSVGRNTTYFFEKDGKRFVLRRYYRGGLIAKWVEDSYLFLGLRKTRAFREMKLLKEMRKRNLPVPEPVALMVSRKGLTYRASIIIRLIGNSRDLFHILRERALTEKEWLAVGRLIRNFHNKGVYHADLNIHNILLSRDGEMWLIDFDRGRFVEPNASNLETNLGRLKRSLEKESKKWQEFHWRQPDWELLLKGYHDEHQ